MAGAMRLIQMRGPGSFQTDFEKSMLLSLMAPIVSTDFNLQLQVILVTTNTLL